MSLIDRVLKTLEDRRQRIIDGDINCIPSPLDKLSNSFPGIEREKYYLISGATKSADFLNIFINLVAYIK